MLKGQWVCNGISTHTLTWSVTGRSNRHFQTTKISTHTLTWSVTILKHSNEDYYRFQLTRSRGA